MASSRGRSDAAASKRSSQGMDQPSRRVFLQGYAGAAVLAGVDGPHAWGQASGAALNLARVATPISLTTTSENKISAPNDGFVPASTRDRKPPWVQYSWSRSVAIDRVYVYWAIDAPHPKGPAGNEFSHIAVPQAYRVTGRPRIQRQRCRSI